MKYFLLILVFALSVSVSEAQSPTDSVPVRLKSFEAGKINNANKLYWSVVCFLQYAKFQIQRSYDAVHYSTINTFSADQLRCRQPFDYEDKSSTGKVFYRILVGDLDGRVFTSKTTVVYGTTKGFDINSISPTLVNAQTTISISSAAAGTAETQVINLQGATVLKQTVQLIAGSNDILFNFTNLAKGYYLFTCRNSEGILKSQRFIKL